MVWRRVYTYILLYVYKSGYFGLTVWFRINRTDPDNRNITKSKPIGYFPKYQTEPISIFRVGFGFGFGFRILCPGLHVMTKERVNKGKSLDTRIDHSSRYYLLLNSHQWTQLFHFPTPFPFPLFLIFHRLGLSLLVVATLFLLKVPLSFCFSYNLLSESGVLWVCFIFREFNA